MERIAAIFNQLLQPALQQATKQVLFKQLNGSKLEITGGYINRATLPKFETYEAEGQGENKFYIELKSELRDNFLKELRIGQRIFICRDSEEVGHLGQRITLQIKSGESIGLKTSYISASEFTQCNRSCRFTSCYLEEK